MLLTPAVDRLQRWKIRRGVAVTIVMVVVFCAAAAAINAVWTPATEWLARAPQTMRKIDPRLQPLREMFERVDDVAQRAGQLTQGNTVVDAASRPSSRRWRARARRSRSRGRSSSGCRSFRSRCSSSPAGRRCSRAWAPRLRATRPRAKSLRLTEAIRQESRPLLRHHRAHQPRPRYRHRLRDVCARHAERDPLGRARGGAQLHSVSRTDRRLSSSSRPRRSSRFEAWARHWPCRACSSRCISSKVSSCSR